MDNHDNSSIPDFAPTVSFDRSLGRLYKNIEFDYETYVSYLQGAGLAETQIADTTITFKRNSFFALVGGRSYRGEKRLEVGIRTPAIGINCSPNDRLAHETGHLVDFETKGESFF